MLFGARKSAATRALGNISALLDQEREAPARELRESGPARAAAGVESHAGRQAPRPKVAAARGRDETPAATRPAARSSEPGAQPAPNGSPTPREPSVESAPSEPPLLEVKQGTLAADIEHIGERLVIFNDRVELHDRSNRVRQVIPGADIADVVVHKKFTGSTVTVESGTGESIVAKGLKPDQADEIRSVILKRTRAGAAAAPMAGTATSRSTRDAAVVDARDPRPTVGSSGREADLLAKLDDLHRAGILTDAELTEKRRLVERIERGETLVVSTPVV